MLKYRARAALLIDGANMYAACRSLNFDFDYKKLLELFNERLFVVRANYYTAVTSDVVFNALKPLLDFLSYNGYVVVTKRAKELTDSQGLAKIKGNMDLELAVDALKLAPYLEELYLFSGDGDFTCVVKAVQELGVKVTVVSTLRGDISLVSNDLRRQADAFIDLEVIRNLVSSSRTARMAERKTQET